jgi:DNA-binding LacI/PurR family transcriptional regulator
MGRVTLQTIADEVGVSRMTVSNAFSRPDQLSPALRERILGVADRLGYCGPDPAARTLSSGQSGTIGVLFTDTLSYAFTDEVATTFLAGVAGVVEREGIGLTVLSAPRIGRDTSVAGAVVDGLIIYSVDNDSAGLQMARRRGLPLVFVDQVPEDGVPSVNVDDRAGARAVAEYVIGLGHRHLGLVIEAVGTDTVLVGAAAEPPHHVVAERLAGWRDAVTAADLPEPVVVNAASNSRADGDAAARLILDTAPQTTALLCLTDTMAFGALDAADARGLKVPADVSIAGFDDMRAAAHTDPPLATVRQPVTEKGRLAAQLLLDRLAEPDVKPASTLLPTELIVRASIGPVPIPRRSS